GADRPPAPASWHGTAGQGQVGPDNGPALAVIANRANRRPPGLEVPLQRAEGYVLIGVDDCPYESRHSRRPIPVAVLHPDAKAGALGLMGQVREIVAAGPSDGRRVRKTFRYQDVDRFPALQLDALLGRQETGGREVYTDDQVASQFPVVQIHRQRAVTGLGDGAHRL